MGYKALFLSPKGAEMAAVNSIAVCRPGPGASLRPTRIARVAVMSALVCGATLSCVDMAPTRAVPSGTPVAFDSLADGMLSEQEVLDLADAKARSEKEPYGPLDLQNYPGRSAKLDATGRYWWVHYTRDPNRWPGDHFSVRVDAVTGETSYFGGL